MYTVKYYLVVPRDVRYGTASDRSPKKAMKEARSLAYEASGCESIAVEGYTLFRDGKKVHDFCDLWFLYPEQDKKLLDNSFKIY